MNIITKIYSLLLVDTTAEERLSSLIKKLRRNKSQRQFAKLLGVSYAAVRSWEERESMPSVKNLTKIADYSNQTLEDLLAYIEDGYEDMSRVDRFQKSYVAEDVIPQIKNMSKSEQSRLAKLLIEELAK